MDSADQTSEQGVYRVCGYRNVPEAFARFKLPMSRWESATTSIRARAMHAFMQLRQQRHRGGHGKDSWRFSS